MKLEHVPTYVMLPFYETLVVGIEPLKDEMTFRRWYGMDVAQIMEMTKSERMRVRLTSPTLLYDGLDYLDPLLETNPPTFIRGEAFGHLVGGEAHLNEADLEFARFKADHEAKAIDSRLGDLRSHYRPSEISVYLEALRMQYLRLAAVGYSGILKQLSASSGGDLLRFAGMLRTYYNCLAAPYFHSLGGIHVLNKKETVQTLQGTEVFPVDVGRFLVKNLELVRAQSLENALDLFPDFRQARKTLYSLDKALDAPMWKNRIEYKASELGRAWHEVSEIHQDISEGARILRAAGIVGAAEAGLVVGGLGGLLAGIGIAVVANKVAKPSATALGKLRKPSHIIDFYELAVAAQEWQSEKGRNPIRKAE